MKKLASLALISLMSISAFSQHGERTHRESDLTPTQKATLRTKKMALSLDLNENQQKQILVLQTDMAVKHAKNKETHKARKEEGKKPSKEERFAFMNAKLDEKLAYQNQMKKILNGEQYDQWKKHHHKRKAKKSQKMRKAKKERKERKRY